MATGEMRGLYLFLGGDRPRKFQRLQELERSIGVQPLDRHHVDAAEMSAAQLLALCRQQPAASPARLIVVDQAHRLSHEAVEALAQTGAVIAKSACVVLLVEVELSVRHPLTMRAEALASERFPGRDVPAVKPFALADALGARDAAAALSAVQDQLLDGREPLELLGLVAWQLNRWVTVKRLSERGYSGDGIGAALGFKPWQVQRLQAEVAHRSLEALQGLLERCWRLDVDAKSGRALPELAIEELVVGACVQQRVM